MGVYLYALNKNTVKTFEVNGQKVRVAESKNHGKPTHGSNGRLSFFTDRYSPQLEAAISRTADHFETHGAPEGFILGNFMDGATVYAYSGASVYDSSRFTKLGNLKKVGRSLTFVPVQQ